MHHGDLDPSLLVLVVYAFICCSRSSLVDIQLGRHVPFISRLMSTNDRMSVSYHLCLTVYEYPAAGAVSGVLEDGSRMHKHDHDGFEAPDESLDSILSSEPKPLGKHRFTGAISGTVSAGSTQVYAVETLSNLVSRSPKVDKLQPLRSGCSVSGISYPFGKQVVVCIDISGLGGLGSGGWCGGDMVMGSGAMHLARRSPAEGGDSEIGGDGDGVVMARSLSTSASGGRDMEV
ncbi:hypothetical protein Tco_0679553 [Tanacetum coccineum]|uniref:Uncharacterized protein n=1 Tax=Tanacetum coccineum TaxID=301880 RepID=A0ABQ4XI69_9ASTR